MRLNKLPLVHQHVRPGRKPKVIAAGFEGSTTHFRGSKRQSLNSDTPLLEAAKAADQFQGTKGLHQQGLADRLQEAARPIMDSIRESSADQHILKAFHVSSQREAKVRYHSSNRA